MDAPNEHPKEEEPFDEEDFQQYLKESRDAEDILRNTPGYMGEFEPDKPLVVKHGKFEF